MLQKQTQCDHLSQYDESLQPERNLSSEQTLRAPCPVSQYGTLEKSLGGHPKPDWGPV